MNPNLFTKSILLVDDDKDIAKLFTEILEVSNYSVRNFTNPLQALEHYRENHNQYGLLISDIQMPEMSGFELVNNLKKIDPCLLVILMTANESIDYSELHGITINECLKKPIYVKELVSKVEKQFIKYPKYLK